MRWPAAPLVLLLVLAGWPVRAQPVPARPSEEALFGAAPAEPAAEPAAGPVAAPAEVPASPGSSREEALFGEAAAARPSAPPSSSSFAPAPADPLTIGGQLYLRAAATVQEGVDLDDAPLVLPFLVDTWFDARPNDRVRGLLLARTRYDPSQIDPGIPLSGIGPGPEVDLDQLWLRFDVARTLFFSAGRQHVKWGPSRFWNPTDFLHQVRRDPLAPFDARLGTTMLKLHLPWERHGWNLYAIALLDDVEPVAALGRVGAAGRAELVFSTVELGVDAVYQHERRTRIGADLSAGLGPLDVYAEAALRRGSDVPHWREAASLTLADGSRVPCGAAGAATPGGIGIPCGEEDTPAGLVVGATLGLDWTCKYSDEDTFTIGGEYFYNSFGYDDERLYPWLVVRELCAALPDYLRAGQPQCAGPNAPGQLVPFYLGRHYAGVFALLPAPGAWNDTTFLLSTLGNLSDRSFLARLDVSWRVLTHLTAEAFAGLHFGSRGGELRFALDIPENALGGQSLELAYPAPRYELGLGLRLAI